MPDTSHKPDDTGLGYTQEDWDEVSDNPKLTPAELAALRPAREVPEVFAHLPKRGRPKLADAKVNLTLRIDPNLLAAYRSTGDGWQVRMHWALQFGLPFLKADTLEVSKAQEAANECLPPDAGKRRA